MMTINFLLIFFFSISAMPIIQPQAANISPGSSLYASNPTLNWSSPSNTFSVGFSQLGPTSYVAAISYSGGLPIWTAGTVDLGGALRFISNGNLRLVNGSGATVWESSTGGLGVSYASIDDSGNLVLVRNDSVPVWSSFQYPTDTIVPSQNFTVNHTLKSGQYSFRLLSSGNLSLRWNNTVLYWNQGLNSSVRSNLTSPTLELQPNGILSLFDLTSTNKYNFAFSSDYGEGSSSMLRFLKLDNDGNLRIYSSASGSGIKTVRWSAVVDQCRVFGFCGNMGVCSYNSSSPICGCPSENFEPIDPKDSKKGCKRKVGIEDCSGSATMLNLEHAEFLTFPPDRPSQVFTLGISACSSNCLGSASCDASTSLSDGSGVCYMKTPGFVSGYKSAALPSTSYVKVCSPAQPYPALNVEAVGERKCWRRPFGILSVVMLLVLIALAGGLFWRCWRNRTDIGGLSAQYELLEYASGAPVRFSYKELKQSTKGFNEKLGAGGFGAVYKGVLANRSVVAVKQLEGIEQGERQFRIEVATISSTHHLNLVRLIGFCVEGRYRLLVYEFMKNGSLDSFLFTTEEQSGKLLNWEYRFKVALGTARGITYLHEECRDCIVHCDIKPENILLDENYNAKVSDFGLAKLLNPKDHRHGLTSVRGTRGYLAPEWLANLPITSKSDVYSYGMVLLEIVSGRRNFEVSTETNGKKFSVWAYENFEKGNVLSIIDRRLADQDMDMQQVMRVVQVSFWCIQEQPSQRPMMGKVVQMLEGITEVETPPAPSLFSQGFMTGNSVGASSDFSTPSMTITSFPPMSSHSALENAGGLHNAPETNLERASSSLLRSDP
ncbi:G-type lectin S-receptor-like serine/threonine-protein kinase [Tripterygium wilfordii]|uniref:Receptor-like serine/threonine-protein kinase n=1 Tax=Tripterygium wilfordii TaxID=458696 RepID=A0A7J7DT51_TRIWF|nr:G-type lectin S-receptor-like serine/threonine-protein kinase At1g34300 [Tripterygium wilfordii]KAF5749324.1 G-type lectin S-receptor-like serine/threonine-protein kinase [Tripterygium wilfordii]